MLDGLGAEEQPLAEAAGAATQRPDSSQTAGNAQSPTSLHDCPHFPFRHAYGAHCVDDPRSRSVWMSSQTAPERHVPVGRSQPNPSAQSASTSQATEHVRLAPSQRWGEQEGTPSEPRTRGVHVPRVSEQVSHAPSHATLQQNDPTQWPLAHSLACSQTDPLRFLHTPSASHVFSPEHVSGSSADRTISHAPVFAAHLRHAPSHFSVQQTDSRQNLVAQSPVVAHVAPTFVPELMKRMRRR